MRLFGFEITRTKAAPPAGLSPVPTRGWGWLGVIRESFPGAWQRNVEINQQDVLASSIVWACITLIAADIAKLWIKLVQKDRDGICSEIESKAYSPVLRKPNHFSTRVKFFEHWIISKLTTGNTYVLKERNNRGGEGNGNVVALYVLDPQRVSVLVAPDGAVFYQLQQDNLSGIDETMAGVAVPASEIIHDICVPLFHPLVGVSPIFACGLAATQALKIQQNSTKLFASGSNLSGVLTAPHTITPQAAKDLQENWDANFSGERNIGKVAVIGGDFKFTPLTMTAVDAQLIDQLKWTAETVCSCFHVPGYMVGIGPAPPYTDIQSINLQYYTQALQNPIENLELLLSEGLEVPPDVGIEFDLAALARMDTKTQMETAAAGVNASVFTPNEARANFDLKPKPGGDQPYLQRQYWPLKQLSERETPSPSPPGGAPAPPATPAMGKDLGDAVLLKVATTDWTIDDAEDDVAA